MRRALLAFMVGIAPLVIMPAAGCEEKKVTTVQQSEQVHESETKMVSPGKPKVE